MKRTPLKRRTPIRTKGGDRFPNRRDDAYREWTRWQPCVLHADPNDCDGPVQACHVVSRGAGGFDWGNLFSACWRGHEYSHRIGWQNFQRQTGVCLPWEALRLFQRWLEETHGFDAA